MGLLGLIIARNDPDNRFASKNDSDIDIRDKRLAQANKPAAHLDRARHDGMPPGQTLPRRLTAPYHRSHK